MTAVAKKAGVGLGLLLAADEQLGPLVKNSVFANCTREVAKRMGSDSLS